MALFTELPVQGGYGPWHVNYFRVFIEPRARGPLPSGDQLIGLMHDVMDPHTAKVDPDQSHPWQGKPTLMFRGVARIRPFGLVGVVPVPLPVPLPKSLEKFGVPESVRTWMTPQIHTDSVGLAVPASAHAFTVLTVKREFETGDDQTIRHLLLQRLEGDMKRLLQAIRDGVARPLPGLPLVDPITEWGRRLVMKWIDWADRAVGDDATRSSNALADIAVAINQHHFLAGRRAFRMATAGELGLVGQPLPGGRVGRISADTWVFETAAVERYSLRLFAEVTERVMGGDAQMLRPVWQEMCEKMAARFGKRLGDIDIQQLNLDSYADVAKNPVYAGIARRHQALVPGA